MRRGIIVVVISTVVVAGAAILMCRRPPDDLGALAQYAASSSTTYCDAQHWTTVIPPYNEPSSPMMVRQLILRKGISLTQAEELVKDQVLRGNNWQIHSHTIGFYAVHPSMESSVTPLARPVITVVKMADMILVLEARPLWIWEQGGLWIKNLGRNPYDMT